MIVWLVELLTGLIIMCIILGIIDEIDYRRKKK